MTAALRLLVLDLDGTLLDSPRVENDNIAGWEQRVLTDPPPPVPGAQRVVARLVRSGLYVPVMVTARSSRLQLATRRNIGWHFPELRAAPLSMGREHADSGGTVYKRVRLNRIRKRAANRLSMLLVDDDASMQTTCLAGDDFWHAPACWLKAL